MRGPLSSCRVARLSGASPVAGRRELAQTWGVKESGRGREDSKCGIEEFLEVK